jgi:photosystem II stability/assembly factor-like uncharacterized protein
MRLFIFSALSIVILSGMYFKSTNESIVSKNELDKKPVVFNGKIMRSSDDGNTWDNISDGLPTDKNIQGFTIDKHGVSLGFSKSKVLTLSKGPHSQWQTENVKEMLVNTTSQYENQVVGMFSGLTAQYAFVAQEGIFKKAFSSSYWQPMNTPTGIYFVNKIIEDIDGTIYISGIDGIHMTKNGGTTWDRVYKQGWMSSMHIDNHTLIASGQNGVMSTSDYGKTWTEVKVAYGHPLFYFSGHERYTFKFMTLGNNIAILRNDSPRDYAGSGRLQLSADGGKTWTLHPADEYLRQLNNINTVLDHNGKLYCSYQDGVVMSADGGKSWKSILTFQQGEGNLSLSLYVSGNELYCITTSSGC